MKHIVEGLAAGLRGLISGLISSGPELQVNIIDQKLEIWIKSWNPVTRT